MKKTIAFLLTLLLLAGCSAVRDGAAGPDTGKAESAAPTASESETTPGAGLTESGTAYGIRYELGDLREDFTALPTAAKPGEIVELRTQVLYDADLHVYVDGREIEKTHFDSDYWGYSFAMPEKDVLVTATPFTKDEIWGTGEDVPDWIRDVRYVRTDGYLEDEEYPKVFWITSAEELAEYYASNKDRYGLESEEFAAALDRYDASFFEENDLIVVLLEEGSGSVRHEVTGLHVTPLQDADKQYEVRPEITRIVPEVGTCDMAEWHIFIEIGKDRGAAVSDLQEPLFTNITR